MADVIQRVRQPEYTGENRCLPCTVVNLAIGFVLAVAALVAAITLDAATLAYPIAVGTFGLASLVIYLRGYLVPGTPELTKRYFPPWLLQWFDKGPAANAAGSGLEDADGEERTMREVDPERYLVEAGALEPCQEVDDLCLTDDFAAAWSDSIAETRAAGTDRDRLLSVLGAEGLDPTFEERGDAFWARTEKGRRIGTWESRAAFLADVAAAPLLEARVDDWDQLSVLARGKLLNGLRLFLEVCPNCEADLAMATDTVESCCSTHTVAALSCDDCGTRLFESDPLPDASEA